MSSWKWFLLSFFGCGIAFWVPDVIIPALDPKEQGYAVTAACPISLILFYVVVLGLRKNDRQGPSSAISAVCGIWVLALSFTLLAQRVRAGKGPEFGWGELGYVLVSSFLPSRIVLFTSLEGSIVALLLGTLAMVICHVAFERHRWIVPPRLLKALHT